MVGFLSVVFTKDGTPLPRRYLYRILLLDQDKNVVLAQ